MIVVVVLLPLLTLSLVVGNCLPETSIYLMLKGECISNGTYFRDTDLQIAGGQDGYIHCVLLNEDLDGGQWLRPDGQPVNCQDGNGTNAEDKIDPFLCTDDSPSANITLYLTDDDYFSPTANGNNFGIETEYKCCLPTNCSDPDTDIMTINVFEHIYITDLYVDLPSDITVFPQYYTVHCIVTGIFNETNYTITVKQYYTDDTDIELTQSYCDIQHDGYSCSLNNTTMTTNYTYDLTKDYTVTVEWEAKNISSGAFRQLEHNGNHEHNCSATVIRSFGGNNSSHFLQRTMLVSIRAPSSSPSITSLVSKTLTSITINWTYPNVSDIDGYVVNASSLNGYVIQQVDGSSVSHTTLNGLLPGTTYEIIVRAYQEILGPASEMISFNTLNTINWSRTSPLTNLFDTEYSIQCVTSTTDPTPYWIVNGVNMSNTNYTLIDDMTYISTLLLYPNNELGQSVNVTCSVEGVRNETITLQAPTAIPDNLTVNELHGTSLNISWSVSGNDIDGFIVAVTPNGLVKEFSSLTFQTLITSLTPGKTYTISVYAYKDLLSVNVTTTVSIATSIFSVTQTGTTVSISSIMVTPTLLAPSGGKNIIILAGGTVGGAVLILAVLIVVVLMIIITIRRAKRSKEIQDGKQPNKLASVVTNKVEKSLQNNVLTDLKIYIEQRQPQKESTISDQLNVESSSTPVPAKRNKYESIYATPADVQSDSSFDNKIPSVHPVKKEDFQSYVTTRDIKAFQQEYRTLYNGMDRHADAGFSPMNRALNRFRNVIPYDDNRVILQKMKHKNCDQDFINASYIDGYSMARKFIATQGPLKSTLVDFMRMIWQERVNVIVMVTNLWEGGRSKCEQYWPSKDENESMFGPFTVKLKDQIIYPEYCLRTMEIKLGDATRHIVHYQLTSWPDHGVLEYPTPLILVHKRVMNEWHSVGGPLLIHCSAGVGRTGTFITLDMALEQVNKEGKVDTAGIVTRLRQQRIKMVQMEEQYTFVHDAILEVLTCGDTEIASNTFLSELEELKQAVDPQTGETSLQTQFRILSQVTPNPGKMIKDTAEAHPDKNRSNKNLPADKHIVPLQERGGYIHASFVRAYGKLRGMIIAQSPMENTANDFWKMVMQYRVSAIVMCCDLIEEGEETCFQYWPMSGEPRVYDQYEVSQSSEAVEKGFIQRSFTIMTHDKKTTWKVKQFQISDWSSDGIVRSPEVILQVIESVIKVQQRSGGGPVVVHCSDTVGRSGVFCAVNNAVERCKTEGLVDIFLTVKSIRMNKPEAVNTLGQYISVYDAVAAFLTANEAYASFL